ncbi:uncharacterized protein LOC117112681 [Anneissia japonica]|uniref:uncharacterized protein LOC117112681 n=1 Tax=Anneissia japonica TaxID=1529436 RepID=UPI0014255EB5|nr:uncharacterized protein LOC117112681 [Anneissia japonica]XP_033111713.1 uncharacterized protein LOC117112681 [Anneissia japonica]XP_033111714.1 uncharacterized protein LOC117112681 [Anneissia japonica]XP_033111715.1 uncharacterized protein LOC117112681 [Anneissia japonica]
MASKKDKAKEDRKFNAIKLEVSTWYDDNNCLNMLKVLFRDKIGYQKLMSIHSTIELLNELFKHDHVSATDLTLLSATITVTQHFALQRKIEEKLPSFPKVNGGTVSKIFSHHRQKLMKFGMALAEGDVGKIDGLYNTTLKKYNDSWSMIIDLETRLEISDGNMEDFTDSLESLELHLALKALTEEIADTPSVADTPDRPTPSDTPQTGNPSWMKKLSTQELRQLLDDVSEWWEQFGNINMLKVILNDLESITLAQIEQKLEPNPLFQLLLANGYISHTNVNYLLEAVVLGGQNGIEPKIKETIPKFPGFSSVAISGFSKYRRNLIEFGKVVGTKNKDRIGNLFGLIVPKLTDQWCLIFELERKRILTEKEKDQFIETLNKNGMTAEAEALNKFKN